ncbi:hypothetical protein ABZ891_32025 [Streptomyces sp. NPDC047023]|uniref:hypothetical protein n=1 Tax=Streptomyces sp. NPDC047023 TaxID=3155139 RepID=UPI0033FE35E8
MGRDAQAPVLPPRRPVARVGGLPGQDAFGSDRADVPILRLKCSGQPGGESREAAADDDGRRADLKPPAFGHEPTHVGLPADTHAYMPDLYSLAVTFLHRLRAALEVPGVGNRLLALAARGDDNPASVRAMELFTEHWRQSFNRLIAALAPPVSAGEFAVLIGPPLYQRFMARQLLTDAFLESVAAGWMLHRE